MFVDRQRELSWLHRMIREQRPERANFFMLYGRRRVGKSALLRRWAEEGGVPFTYWVADKEPALIQRRRLFAQILGANPATATITFDSWGDLWEAAVPVLTARPRILILDELPYASDADPATLSALQHAWDLHFQETSLTIVICGSNVRIMERMIASQSPLFGRLTGLWKLQPLPFGALRAWFPTWDPDAQVAIYALVGGVPAYLSWFRPERSLLESVRDVMLAPGSLALGEVLFLLYDEVREPRPYLAILEAIGSGHHTFSTIQQSTLISDVSLPGYLTLLQELGMIERRVPAGLPIAKQRISKQGRYHLSDPFLRFYFRFIHRHAELASYAPERILPALQDGLRAFVGATAWEDLARTWVRVAARQAVIDWFPETVGSHWGRTAQIDVVAANWRERGMLLGECKWGLEPVGRDVVRELIHKKAPPLLATLPGGASNWRITYALFARAGATPAAAALLAEHGGQIIDLQRLYDDLAEPHL